MFSLNSAEGYFLHLIKTALKDEPPEEKPNEVEWEKVFEIALRQNAANLAWFSIEKLNNKPQGEIYNMWQQVYAKAASKCLKQMMEIDLLSEEFTNRGYDIMFLKGSKIRSYYPSPDMRTMTDIDLLIKAEDRQPIREIMRSLGYEEDLMDDGQVDAFKKQPVIYTEIHYDLMYKTHQYHEFFHADWNSFIETEKPHVYEMTFEDLYCFNIGHYAKNMYSKGIGVRSVVDCYILWNKATEKQKELIQQKLKEKQLLEFNSKLVEISDIWFNDCEDNCDLEDVQQLLLSNGVYGSKKNLAAVLLMDNSNAKSSRFSFFMKRIFPSANYLFERYGIKHRNILLIPFLWIRRVFGLIFSNKEKTDSIKAEVNNLESINDSDIEFVQSVYKKFGLIDNE